MKHIPKHVFIEIMLLFCIACIPLLWLKPGEMILGHDTGIRLNNIDHFKNIFFSWDAGTNMGRDLTIAKGFLIAKIPETLFYALTHTFGVSQPLTFITWFLIMEGCMYWVLSKLFYKPNQWFIRLWGTTLFVYNFFILQAWTIAERAKFSAYAALPLLFLFLYQGLTGARSTLATAIAIGMTTLFLNGGSSPPLFGGILITVGVTAIVMTVWNADSMGILGSIRKTLTVSVLALIVTLALNAYWLLPQAHLFTTSYKDALAGQGGTEGILAWEAQVSRDASLTNLLRLQGVPGMTNLQQYPFMQAFQTNPLLILWSFLPIVSILIGFLILWFTDTARRGLLASLAGALMLGIIFTAGSHPPFGFVYTFFVQHIPGFSIFRSSFLKFAPALWFSVSLLSGFALWQLTDFFKTKFLKQISRITLCVLLFVTNLAPFLSPTFFAWVPAFSTKVTVPSYVMQTTETLEQTVPPTGRVLLLPPFDEQTHADSYRWGYWSLNTLPGSAFSQSVVANDAHNPPSIVDDIYEALAANDSKTSVALLHRAGITHILWRDDILWFDKQTTGKQFQALKKTLASLPFQKTYTNGPWSVYTTQQNTLPLVHAATMLTSVYAKRPRISTLAPSLSDATAVVFSPPSLTHAMQPFVHEELVGAQCIFCHQSDQEAFRHALTIVPPRILPGTLFYPLVLWKEKRQWKEARTPTERIDALLAFSNRRLAELSKIIPGSLMRENRLVTYQQTIEAIMKEFQTLHDLDMATYAVKIALYFETQQAYIAESHLRIPQPLLQKLTDHGEELHSYWRTNDEKTHSVALQFPTQKAGTYRLIPPFEIQKQAKIVVDGNSVSSNLSLFLAPGLHTLTIRYTNPHPTYDVPIVRIERVEQFTPPQPSKILFKRLNPTLVQVSLPAREAPMMLVFREAYHPEWLLTSYSDKTLGNNHFMVDGYANGWIVPAGPPLEATISYYPQQIFYIGLGISCISFVLVLVVLFLNKRKGH